MGHMGSLFTLIPSPLRTVPSTLLLEVTSPQLKWSFVAKTLGRLLLLLKLLF